MQNHSGYKSAWYHLDRSISVSGAPYSADTSANQYFSLLKASDDAIKELIEHYKNYDGKDNDCLFRRSSTAPFQ